MAASQIEPGEVAVTLHSSSDIVAFQTMVSNPPTMASTAATLNFDVDNMTLRRAFMRTFEAEIKEGSEAPAAGTTMTDADAAPSPESVRASTVQSWRSIETVDTVTFADALTLSDATLSALANRVAVAYTRESFAAEMEIP